MIKTYEQLEAAPPGVYLWKPDPADKSAWIRFTDRGRPLFLDDEPIRLLKTDDDSLYWLDHPYAPFMSPLNWSYTVSFEHTCFERLPDEQ